MSGADENKSWAMLAQHAYAMETMAVMHGVIMFNALCAPDDFEDFLEKAEDFV